MADELSAATLFYIPFRSSCGIFLRQWRNVAGERHSALTKKNPQTLNYTGANARCLLHNGVLLTIICLAYHLKQALIKPYACKLKTDGFCIKTRQRLRADRLSPA